MDATDAWVRSIAAHRLGGVVYSLGPPPSDTNWDLQLRTLSWHRLTGLALDAVERGAVTLSAAKHDDLLTEHRSWMDAGLLVEQRLLAVYQRLSHRGVRSVVLKGPATAHGYYPDANLRPFADVDLLVGAADWRRACSVLLELGATRCQPEPRVGFDERFGKAATHRLPDGIDIDLHRTLAPGPFGLWLDPDELIERAEPFALGGTSLARLDPSAAWLHACLHAALGTRPPVLLAIRDVAQLHESAAIDWDVVTDWLRRWRLTVVVERALDLVEHELDVARPAVPASVLARPSSSTETLALSAYTTSRRDRGWLALSSLLAIPGLRQRAAYLTALLLPRRGFLDARHGASRGRYVRRWRAGLRRLLGRRRSTTRMEAG